MIGVGTYAVEFYVSFSVHALPLTLFIRTKQTQNPRNVPKPTPPFFAACIIHNNSKQHTSDQRVGVVPVPQKGEWPCVCVFLTVEKMAMKISTKCTERNTKKGDENENGPNC